jgi:hypothetical protein
MKFLAAVIAMVVLGGGAMMGMGYSQQSAAAASAAGGVSCVLPPGQGLPAVGPWPDTLDPVHVAQVAAAAGFTGPDLTIAVAVASAESSHRPQLTNQNTDKHRSVDYGLWQINGYYHPEQMATGDWANPWDNARMAHSIWEESQNWGGGWGSWVTWKKDLHTKYMAEATAAVAQLTKLGSDAGTCLPGPAGEGGAACQEARRSAQPCPVASRRTRPSQCATREAPPRSTDAWPPTSPHSSTPPRLQGCRWVAAATGIRPGRSEHVVPTAARPTTTSTRSPAPPAVPRQHAQARPCTNGGWRSTSPAVTGRSDSATNALDGFWPTASGSG